MAMSMSRFRCAWGLLVWAVATVGRPAAATAERPGVTLDSLLAELTDRDAVARWPAPPYVAHLASSYDRRRVAPGRPGWFANDDHSQYVRTEDRGGRRERVMMDVDGPGAIVRFWVTTGRPKSARLRLYLDGADRPAIEWRSDDLFDADLTPGQPLLTRHPPPLGHGGSTSYLPVPYARHCKLTLEEVDPNAREPRYYQLAYRTYAAGTEVQSFSRDVFAAARPALDRVNAALANPPVPATAAETSLAVTLPAGQERTLELPAGPTAVRQLELSVGPDLSPADRERALRTVVLRGSFDDQADAIWCPVGDFAGSGPGGRPLASWSRTVDDHGRAVGRWTMPYRASGRLAVLNLGTAAVDVRLVARTGAWTWDARSLYFHANWHQQVHVAARPRSDWTSLAVTGRGLLVGDVLSVFNPVPAWYGEGDEKLWVDAEPFPSQIGTGVEDYYNASWAPNPVYQSPFASHPRIDEPRSRGQNVYTRTRSLDAVPFTRSLRFDTEVWTWRDAPVDYAATTYWYGSPGAVAAGRPELAEVRRPLPSVPAPFRLPDAIECESTAIVDRTPGVSADAQDMTPFDGQWSGDAHLFIRGRRPGDSVTLAIPAAGTAPRRLTLYATKARDYGTLAFTVNGRKVGVTFDGYAANVTPSGPIDLGTHAPEHGRLLLRVDLTGTNPRSDGARFYAGLDAVVVAAAP